MEKTRSELRPNTHQSVPFSSAKVARTIGMALQTAPTDIDYEGLTEAELAAASEAPTDQQRYHHLDQAAIYAALGEKHLDHPPSTASGE